MFSEPLCWNSHTLCSFLSVLKLGWWRRSLDNFLHNGESRHCIVFNAYSQFTKRRILRHNHLASLLMGIGYRDVHPVGLVCLRGVDRLVYIPDF